MFKHEDQEWRRDVHAMTESDREVSVDSRRAAVGVIGDREDER